MSGERSVKVGVGAYVVRGNKVLLGKRKGAHGEGCYAPSGGHLEFGESFQDCAIRESLEETGIRISNPRIFYTTNDFFKEDSKHYVTIHTVSFLKDGQEPELLEPDKSESWEWFDLDNLPRNLMVPIQNAINEGFDYKNLVDLDNK